ncbi:MAG: prephenate dehydrogenase/arogenate dehydrogenase family protein [Acidobacteriaceae bacterium]|nr:prephenate dehydrogenase/arogenate dehydrogenase family protein [Acidobacteriaceae bacterium]MBV9038786.1 prephenate dehydrogenase/arogenate dehydrogenase family protein [Acidobacteriaceae bacterium]MBV9222657.1 prephenate dehydrogenase/arogenate dehydrogenase family protein [Acidobacteriaceae bacterium]MBV9307479.1 prephenate dehydrogenase/arogenate dehydrogenase family protein [Acidobacteriaceae bacterium]MBV9675320.1 prephenate dehydrogenase/arogenate dehydrogenase family protein [Acidoba
MADRAINTVAIVGLGLIGGSFGLALRKAGFEGEIVGVCAPPYAEKALEIGAISRKSDSLHEIAESADLIYLAHKVDSIISSLDVLGPIARPGCLLTDSGSTKAVITAKAAESVKFAEFVGGHPMAGKERRGIENADADLFRGRPYILTTPHSNSLVLNEFKSWLARIGAHIVSMSSREHDCAVAFTSHLPQLLSTTLASTLETHHQEAFTEVFGPGLLDMTRLALSASDLWMSILETNKEEVLGTIDAFSRVLAIVRKRLVLNELEDTFTSAAEYAKQFRK